MEDSPTKHSPTTTVPPLTKAPTLLPPIFPSRPPLYDHVGVSPNVTHDDLQPLGKVPPPRAPYAHDPKAWAADPFGAFHALHADVALSDSSSRNKAATALFQNPCPKMSSPGMIDSIGMVDSIRKLWGAAPPNEVWTDPHNVLTLVSTLPPEMRDALMPEVCRLVSREGAETIRNARGLFDDRFLETLAPRLQRGRVTLLEWVKMCPRDATVAWHDRKGIIPSFLHFEFDQVCTVVRSWRDVNVATAREYGQGPENDTHQTVQFCYPGHMCDDDMAYDDIEQFMGHQDRVKKYLCEWLHSCGFGAAGHAAMHEATNDAGRTKLRDLSNVKAMFPTTHRFLMTPLPLPEPDEAMAIRLVLLRAEGLPPPTAAPCFGDIPMWLKDVYANYLRSLQRLPIETIAAKVVATSTRMSWACPETLAPAVVAISKFRPPAGHVPFDTADASLFQWMAATSGMKGSWDTLGPHLTRLPTLLGCRSGADNPLDAYQLPPYEFSALWCQLRAHELFDAVLRFDNFDFFAEMVRDDNHLTGLVVKELNPLRDIVRGHATKSSLASVCTLVRTLLPRDTPITQGDMDRLQRVMAERDLILGRMKGGDESKSKLQQEIRERGRFRVSITASTFQGLTQKERISNAIRMEVRSDKSWISHGDIVAVCGLNDDLREGLTLVERVVTVLLEAFRCGMFTLGNGDGLGIVVYNGNLTWCLSFTDVVGPSKRGKYLTYMEGVRQRMEKARGTATDPRIATLFSAPEALQICHQKSTEPHPILEAHFGVAGAKLDDVAAVLPEMTGTPIPAGALAIVATTGYDAWLSAVLALYPSGRLPRPLELVLHTDADTFLSDLLILPARARARYQLHGQPMVFCVVVPPTVTAAVESALQECLQRLQFGGPLLHNVHIVISRDHFLFSKMPSVGRTEGSAKAVGALRIPNVRAVIGPSSCGKTRAIRQANNGPSALYEVHLSLTTTMIGLLHEFRKAHAANLSVHLFVATSCGETQDAILARVLLSPSPHLHVVDALGMGASFASNVLFIEATDVTVPSLRLAPRLAFTKRPNALPADLLSDVRKKQFMETWNDEQRSRFHAVYAYLQKNDAVGFSAVAVDTAWYCAQPNDICLTKAKAAAKASKHIEVVERIAVPYLLTRNAKNEPQVYVYASRGQGDIPANVTRCPSGSVFYLGDLTPADLAKLVATTKGPTTEGEGVVVWTPSLVMAVARVSLMIRCGLSPGVLVGESGCGKTFLIKRVGQILGYATVCLDVTASTTLAEIRTFLHKEVVGARKGKLLVFFDEFNTSRFQDVIKLLVTDRTWYETEALYPSELAASKALPDILASRDVVFLGACNPYHVLAAEGRLSYNVDPFVHPTVECLAWALEDVSGDARIQSVVRVLVGGAAGHEEFVRQTADIYQELRGAGVRLSFRDIARAALTYLKFGTFVVRHIAPPPGAADVTHALLFITMFCCAEASSSSASAPSYAKCEAAWKRVRDTVMAKFFPNLQRTDATLVQHEGLRTALAMGFLCVQLRLRLLLLGLPGSSKTKAITMILDALLASNDKALRVSPLYFQCSVNTLQTELEKIFSTANLYLKKASSVDDAVYPHPLLVFDEIGLAQLAPSNPIKCFNAQMDTSDASILATSNYNVDRSYMGRCIILICPLVPEEMISLQLASKSVPPARADKFASCLQTHGRRLAEIRKKTPGAFLLPWVRQIGLRDIYSLFLDEAGIKADLDRAAVQAFGFGLPDTETTGSMLAATFPTPSARTTHYAGVEAAVLATKLKLGCPRHRKRPLLVLCECFPGALQVIRNLGRDDNMHILFGNVLLSSEDMRDTHLCVVKRAMESGSALILFNTPYLMESLMDVLSAGFIKVGDGYCARVSMGGASRLWTVAEGFMCVWIQLPQASAVDTRRSLPAVIDRFERRYHRTERDDAWVVDGAEMWGVNDALYAMVFRVLVHRREEVLLGYHANMFTKGSGLTGMALMALARPTALFRTLHDVDGPATAVSAITKWHQMFRPTAVRCRARGHSHVAFIRPCPVDEIPDTDIAAFLGLGTTGTAVIVTHIGHQHPDSIMESAITHAQWAVGGGNKGHTTIVFVYHADTTAGGTSSSNVSLSYSLYALLDTIARCLSPDVHDVVFLALLPTDSPCVEIAPHPKWTCVASEGDMRKVGKREVPEGLPPAVVLGFVSKGYSVVDALFMTADLTVDFELCNEDPSDDARGKERMTALLSRHMIFPTEVIATKRVTDAMLPLTGNRYPAELKEVCGLAGVDVTGVRSVPDARVHPTPVTEDGRDIALALNVLSRRPFMVRNLEKFIRSLPCEGLLGSLCAKDLPPALHRLLVTEAKYRPTQTLPDVMDDLRHRVSAAAVAYNRELDNRRVPKSPHPTPLITRQLLNYLDSIKDTAYTQSVLTHYGARVVMPPAADILRSAVPPSPLHRSAVCHAFRVPLPKALARATRERPPEAFLTLQWMSAALVSRYTDPSVADTLSIRDAVALLTDGDLEASDAWLADLKMKHLYSVLCLCHHAVSTTTSTSTTTLPERAVTPDEYFRALCCYGEYNLAGDGVMSYTSAWEVAAACSSAPDPVVDCVREGSRLTRGETLAMAARQREVLTHLELHDLVQQYRATQNVVRVLRAPATTPLPAAAFAACSMCMDKIGREPSWGCAPMALADSKNDRLRAIFQCRICWFTMLDDATRSNTRPTLLTEASDEEDLAKAAAAAVTSLCAVARLVERYECQRVIRSRVRFEETVFVCPSRSHVYFQCPLAAEGAHVYCEECQAWKCPKCKLSAHPARLSCEGMREAVRARETELPQVVARESRRRKQKDDTHKAVLAEFDAEIALVAKQKSDFVSSEESMADTMLCPACTVPFVRISGCDHMVCGACKHRFNFPNSGRYKPNTDTSRFDARHTAAVARKRVYETTGSHSLGTPQKQSHIPCLKCGKKNLCGMVLDCILSEQAQWVCMDCAEGVLKYGCEKHKSLHTCVFRVVDPDDVPTVAATPTPTPSVNLAHFKCPKCGTNAETEKGDGCMHLKCICGHEFYMCCQRAYTKGPKGNSGIGQSDTEHRKDPKCVAFLYAWNAHKKS